MKMNKKTAILALTFGLVGTLGFAACGGKGNDDGKGETLANEAAWTQAVTDTAVATNATISITSKEEYLMGEFFEKEEAVITAKVADGKVYAYEKTDASWYYEEDGVVERDEEHDEDQTYIAMVDGVATEYFKDLENDWQTYPYDGWTEFSPTVGFLLDWKADFGVTYVISMYEAFENKNGTYVCEMKGDDDNYSSKAELKFVNGKIAWGKVSETGSHSDDGQTVTSTWELSFTITYGGATVGKLPGQEETPDGGNSSSADGDDSSEVNSGTGKEESDSGNGGAELPDTSVEIPDVDGEEVADLAAWDAAWENTIKARNFTATYMDTYTFNGKTETEYGVAMIADGKGYMYDYDDTYGYSYMYIGEVDGKSYEWTSKDGENWEVEETFDDIEQMTSGYVIVRGLEQMLDFSTAQYVDGYYVCTTDWATFNIKIADGYVVEITMVDETETMSYKMCFGNATVGELPALPQEEEIIGDEIKDVSEWEEILANTQAQTNFTYTAEERIDREDGKISIMTEYVVTDNGKIYVEREQTVHNGNGSAMGSIATYYQGYVDGVAYEWRDIGSGEFFATQIEMVDEVTAVTLLGLDDLDFATAKFDKETGAYVFETDGAVITVKAVNSLICAMELSTETMFVEYNYVYGNASVELPPLSDGNGDGDNGDEKVDLPEVNFDFDKALGNDIIGEEVSNDIMEKAIAEALDSTNFTMKGHSFVQDGVSLYVSNVTNGKMYSVTQSTYPMDDEEYETTTIHMIAGEVNGTDWAWMSFDGINWQNGPAEDVIMGGWKSGDEVFGIILRPFLQMDCEFDASTGEYFISMDGTTVAIKIVDNEVKTVYMTDGDMYILYVIEYGNAVDFTLPPVTNGDNGGGSVNVPEVNVPFSDEVDMDVWEKAIADLRASTNFSLTCTDTIVMSDYSMTVVITMQIADDKGYAVAIIQGEEQSAYIGNVDDKNYNWNSKDGKTWTCECMGDAFAIDGAYFLDEMMPEDMTFETVAFDDEEGGYKYVISETDYVVIGFTDGQVSFVKTVSTEDYDCIDIEVYVITYGNASVGDLPPVENVIDNNGPVSGGGSEQVGKDSEQSGGAV